MLCKSDRYLLSALVALGRNALSLWVYLESLCYLTCVASLPCDSHLSSAYALVCGVAYSIVPVLFEGDISVLYSDSRLQRLTCPHLIWHLDRRLPDRSFRCWSYLYLSGISTVYLLTWHSFITAYFVIIICVCLEKSICKLSFCSRPHGRVFSLCTCFSVYLIAAFVSWSARKADLYIRVIHRINRQSWYSRQADRRISALWHCRRLWAVHSVVFQRSLAVRAYAYAAFYWATYTVGIYTHRTAVIWHANAVLLAVWYLIWA